MKKIYLTFLCAIVFWSITLTAFAAIQLEDDFRPSNLPTLGPATGSEIVEVEGHPEAAATQTLILYVGKLVGQILVFCGALTVVYIIIAGAKYVFAYGSDDKGGEAKRGMTWSIVGLILIILSYSIVRGVIKILVSTDVNAT